MIFELIDAHGNIGRFDEDPDDRPFSDAFCDALYDALEQLPEVRTDVTVRVMKEPA